MEQLFYLKFRENYITLYDKDVVEGDNFYDICNNKIHATKFNRAGLMEFNIKYSHLQQWRIKFGVEIA